jgi:ABC-type glycerol-3-phosphate transport system substrate-binding protein
VLLSTGVMGLFYNKKHFQAAGLDPNKPPTNQSDFIAAAQALTREGRYGWVRDAQYWIPWYTMNWQEGGSLLASSGQEDWQVQAAKSSNLASDAAIAAAQFEKDLVQKYKVCVPQFIDIAQLQNVFLAEKVSMISLGPWNLRLMFQSNQQNGTDIGWSAMPQFFPQLKAVQSTSHIWGIMRSTPENPDTKQGAQKFLNYLMTTGQVTWAQAHAPTNIAALSQMQSSSNAVARAMTLWVEQAKYAQFQPADVRWNQISGQVSEALQKICYRNAPVADTLRGVKQQADTILQQQPA